MNIHNFILKIVQSEDKYLIFAELAMRGQVGPEAINCSDLKDLSNCFSLNDHGRPQEAAHVGHRLYDLLLQGEVRGLFASAAAQADESEEPLRILVTLDRVQDLHSVPFELLHDGKEFLALNRLRSIVRNSKDFQNKKMPPIDGPLRVLLTTACAKEMDPDWEDDERYIRGTLQEFGDRVSLRVEHDINSGRLLQIFRRSMDEEKPFHIWHHYGQGGFAGQDYSLFFVKRDRSKDPANMSYLNNLICGNPFLRMVVFSLRHDALSVGFAEALASLAVPCAVGFPAGAIDESIHACTKHFYDRLFRVPVDLAVNRMRYSLSEKESCRLSGWLRPIVCMHSSETVDSLVIRASTHKRERKLVETGLKETVGASIAVFLCGTSLDLASEREAVLEAIDDMECDQVSMEFFGARHDTPLDTCLEEVRKSDIIVVIVGHQYGSLVPNLGISFSEAEYREANRLGKNCLVFIPGPDALVFRKNIERDPHKLDLLNKWEGALRERHTVAEFRDSDDLADLVRIGLDRELKRLQARNSLHD